MISPLQVQKHWFNEMSLVPATDLSESEKKLRSITINQELTVGHALEDDLLWMAKLKLHLVDQEKGNRSLYKGAFEVIGNFKVHPDYPKEQRRKLVSISGGGILYSSVREWVACLSARSLHGPVELPTIDPRAFITEEPTMPAAKKAAKKKLARK
jgi:preprotein translocase subunit SecB